MTLALRLPLPETSPAPAPLLARARRIHLLPPLPPQKSPRSVVLEAIDDPVIRRRLFDKARSFLGNAADAEECVQDTLLLAARNAHRFEDRAAPTTWLFSILINSCRMYIRRVARHDGPRFDPVSEPVGDPHGIDPERQMMGAEVEACVRRVLDRSSTEDQQIFESCVAGSMGPLEFSRAHGLSESMVKTRLYRLRRRMAAELGELAG